jgi:hypothetical protein
MMDARYGFLWGSDPATWDWQKVRTLVVHRGRLPLYFLARRHTAEVADLAWEHGLVLRRIENHWEVTL